MKFRPVLLVPVALLVGAAAWFTFGRSTPEPVAMSAKTETAIVQIALPPSLSEDAELGKQIYDAKCATCHAPNAVGQDGVAPPLVHGIYEPNHHGDEAFQRAAAQGVKAHHWRFGDMPPVEGLTRGDVAMIVAYIRELQRANGIE